MDEKETEETPFHQKREKNNEKPKKMADQKTFVKTYSTIIFSSFFVFKLSLNSNESRKLIEGVLTLKLLFIY